MVFSSDFCIGAGLEKAGVGGGGFPPVITEASANTITLYWFTVSCASTGLAHTC